MEATKTKTPADMTSEFRTGSLKRRPWVLPASEYRGSVANLVQIQKVSAGHDTCGNKRLAAPFGSCHND